MRSLLNSSCCRVWYPFSIISNRICILFHFYSNMSTWVSKRCPMTKTEHLSINDAVSVKFEGMLCPVSFSFHMYSFEFLMCLCTKFASVSSMEAIALNLLVWWKPCVLAAHTKADDAATMHSSTKRGRTLTPMENADGNLDARQRQAADEEIWWIEDERITTVVAATDSSSLQCVVCYVLFVNVGFSPLLIDLLSNSLDEFFKRKKFYPFSIFPN